MDINTLVVGLVIGIIVLFIKYRTNWFSRSGHMDEFDVVLEYREKPDPQQIMAEVSELSPVQIQDPSKIYKGLLVKWHVTYESASMRNLDGTMDLWFSPWSSSNYLRVICAVDLEQYPIMETLKAGHKMWLAGTIESVLPPVIIRLAPGAILKP